MIKSKIRLEAIAAHMPDDCSVFADIGCDHGLLAAELVLTGAAERGFACDINRLPLEKAQKTIECAGLGDRIRTVLTNGLEGLPLEEIDTIIIAGMGGDLIWDILAAAPPEKLLNKRFVLQPMSKPEHLRRKLWENGYVTIKEQAVFEREKRYAVIVCTRDGKVRERDFFRDIAGALDPDANPENRRYLEKECARLEKISAARGEFGEQRAEIQNAVLRLKELLGEE